MRKLPISSQKKWGIIEDDILFIEKSIKFHFKPGIYVVYSTNYPIDSVRKIKSADKAFDFLTCGGKIYRGYLKFWIWKNLFIHLKSEGIVNWKDHHFFYTFIIPIENAIKDELWARDKIIDEIYYWSWEKEFSREELKKYSDEKLIELCRKYARIL